MNRDVEMQPLVFDLFCGLGGWSEAFISAGYRAVGFDVEAHDYGNGGYPGQLVLRDVRSLNGAEMVREFGVPAIIVGSPPCQEFSYMAMPWSKAKEKQRRILADPQEQVRLTDLFWQCFRIQREVSEAAGHYVPMVVENVCGAQKWVGKARWHFGSFYLWGDVPALMPIPAKSRATKVPSATGRRTDVGLGARFTSGEGIKMGDRRVRAANGELKWSVAWNAIKQGGDWFSDPESVSRKTSSKCVKRKQASAEIAKIPPPLAAWIAKVFKPT